MQPNSDQHQLKPRFVEKPLHRKWLVSQAMDLLDFFQYQSVCAAGGFSALNTAGQPQNSSSAGVRYLHDTTRMIYCFALAHMMGKPGADRVIDHGMRFLQSAHRDDRHGGYFWSVTDAGPVDASKQAYGHAFVILAASAAQAVHYPGAERLLEEALHTLQERFWDQQYNISKEEFHADWSEISTYRGQNANMHLTEALMAAHFATGRDDILHMAEAIAERIINSHARAANWVVVEHFNADWQADRGFEGNPMFRPFGTTPGHALEWSRLLVQLWQQGGKTLHWLPEAAKALFATTVQKAWEPNTGGFYYTQNWDGTANRPDRFWWPCAEAIAASAVLGAAFGDNIYEQWYRKVWSFTDSYLIDHHSGGWHPELNAALMPIQNIFAGKPDLYHALQACLMPLFATNPESSANLIENCLTRPLII